MRDQDRAKLAHRDVLAVKEKGQESYSKKYATYVHKMPALISSAGLCQAVWFIHSRNTGKDAADTFLVNLAQQLAYVEPKLKGASAEGLCKVVEEATLSTYLRLTQEAFLCSAWYRRMVQGVLKIDASEGDDD